MAADLYRIQEKMGRLRAQLDQRGPYSERTLAQALDVSWIFHDSALEGDVLDGDEIVAALGGQPPVAGSTEQVSRRIRTAKAALDLARREARTSCADSDAALALLKKLHLAVSLDPASRGGRYRRNSASHRAYFHDVAKPSRISYLLRRLFAWLESEEARRMHPIRVAAEVLYRLVTTSPFEDCSGQVSRLFTSHYLLAQGYLPAIIHAKDRQRYYEAFIPPDSDDLVELLAASLENCIDSSLRLVEQQSRQATASAGSAA